MNKNTTIARNTASLDAVFLFFLLHLPFCDDLVTFTNSVHFSHCQFKFLVSQVDFGKPYSGLKAETWFAKINLRHKELALTVGKNQSMYKSQNHHKRWLKGKNKKKHTEMDHFFQMLGSWSHCHLIFLSTVHIFNPIVTFSSIVCAFLRQT